MVQPFVYLLRVYVWLHHDSAGATPVNSKTRLCPLDADNGSGHLLTHPTVLPRRISLNEHVTPRCSVLVERPSLFGRRRGGL